MCNSSWENIWHLRKLALIYCNFFPVSLDVFGSYFRMTCIREVGSLRYISILYTDHHRLFIENCIWCSLHKCEINFCHWWADIYCKTRLHSFLGIWELYMLMPSNNKGIILFSQLFCGPLELDKLLQIYFLISLQIILFFSSNILMMPFWLGTKHQIYLWLLVSLITI